MTMISVVCGGHMEDPAEYVAYLSQLSEHPSVSEIVVPLTVSEIADDRFSQQFFDLVDASNSKVVPFVPGNDLYSPKALNQAVANANNEMVLVLEKPLLIEALDFQEVGQILLEKKREIVGFTHRVLSEGSAGSSRDWYFKSVPTKSPSEFPAYAINRRYFLELRGFDETRGMKGILGPDLFVRHQRRGGSILKLSKDTGVVYSTKGFSKFKNELSLTAEQIRTTILAKSSIYRNLIDWSVPTELRVPLVSVAIATKDRANLVGESISSVLYQSFQDFEIVVVDDGSGEPDEVEQAVYASKDERIRLFRNAESRGVSFARNRAADSTDCLLTAVHDDDDIMLPRRLEWGIEALGEHGDASYGSWTNFDHSDGKMRTFLTRKDFDSTLVSFSGEGPGHSTWTIPTQVIKTLRYNETLTSSVDHYLATRAAAAGVKWVHISKVAYLRRVHDFQLTSQDTARQKSGHTLSKYGNTFLASKKGLAEMQETGSKHVYPAVRGAKLPAVEFSGYLPDHLVRRDVIIEGNVSNVLATIGLPTKMVSIMEDRDLNTGNALAEQGILKDLTFEELVQIRKSGITKWRSVGTLKGNPAEVIEQARTESQAVPEARELAEAWGKVFEQVQSRLRLVLEMFRKDLKNGYFVVIDHGREVPELEVPAFFKSARLQRRLLVRGELGVQVCYCLYGFESLEAAISTIDLLRKKESGKQAAIYPGVSAESLLGVLANSRERSMLSTSDDDSGLGE